MHTKLNKKKAPIELDFQNKFRKSTLELLARDMIAQKIKEDKVKLIKEYPTALLDEVNPERKL